MAAPLRVVFMGTPDFAVPSLRKIAAHPELATIIAVYTQPDRPAGRGMKMTAPPVKHLAQELGLTIFQPENINEPDEKRKLADQMADVVVVVAYAQFLSKAILNTPRLGCVNVHSSLLPKFRGAAPIQYAIWRGEKESGITTMRLVSKMDAGPILLQRSIPISEEMTTPELHDKLAEIGGDLILETLAGLQNGSVTETPQDESQVTYASLIKKEDGRIDWNKSGVEIKHQVRALNPWPGTFTHSTRGAIKIHKIKLHDKVLGAPNTAEPGETFIGAGGLWVRCSDAWIELLTVQPEGKKAMSVQEFLNGLREKSLSLTPKESST